jgi:hypothetical protein
MTMLKHQFTSLNTLFDEILNVEIDWSDSFKGVVKKLLSYFIIPGNA